ARPVPKSVYAGTGEKEALERRKEENRARVQERFEEAQRSQFQVLQRSIKAPAAAAAAAASSPASSSGRASAELGSPGKKTKKKPGTWREPPAADVKLTTAAILREDALVRRVRRDEERRLDDVEWCLRDTAEFEAWKAGLTEKAEASRRLQQEKLRLEVQLAREGAQLARLEVERGHRGVAREVRDESGALREEALARDRAEREANRRKIDEVHEVHEGAARARGRVVEENARKAMDVALENQVLKEQQEQALAEERARKAELIQQIRLLERSIPPVGSAVKKVDLTETAHAGLLGEMSIAE
ncbi:hypothetical protein HK405_016071, partial [Cladochytrium tenue]